MNRHVVGGEGGSVGEFWEIWYLRVSYEDTRILKVKMSIVILDEYRSIHTFFHFVRRKDVLKSL